MGANLPLGSKIAPSLHKSERKDIWNRACFLVGLIMPVKFKKQMLTKMIKMKKGPHIATDFKYLPSLS